MSPFYCIIYAEVNNAPASQAHGVGPKSHLRMERGSAKETGRRRNGFGSLAALPKDTPHEGSGPPF
jgi:hypothetical protein